METPKFGSKEFNDLAQKYFSGNPNNMETKQKTLAEENRIIEQRASSLKSIVGLGLSIEDCRRFVAGVLNEAAELYAGQTKKSEMVSLEVEEAAKEYAKKQGTHDKPEITEHDFIQGAKWQSQQPIKLSQIAFSEPYQNLQREYAELKQDVQKWKDQAEGYRDGYPVMIEELKKQNEELVEALKYCDNLRQSLSDIQEAIGSEYHPANWKQLWNNISYFIDYQEGIVKKHTT